MLSGIEFSAIAIAFTALARAPYLALALHMDTGFYVSNASIVARRPRIAEGWNVRFAGASKLLPELFYTTVFLARSGTAYKRSVRIAEAALHLLTAWVCYLAVTALGAGPTAGLGAALAFLAVTSEPDYGSYFECAEHLEPLFHLAAFAMIVLGVSSADSGLMGLGIFVLATDVLFVKLSSLGGAAIAAAAALIAAPVILIPATIAGATALGLYLVWIVAVGGSPWRLLERLRRHQAFGKSDFGFLKSVPTKMRFLLRIVSARPWVPALAIYGLANAGPLLIPLGIYLAAVLLVYFIQPLVIWYHAFLFSGPIAIAAGLAARDLATRPLGRWVLAVVATCWILQHLFDSYGRKMRSGDEAFARRVWRLHNQSFGTMNRRVEKAALHFAPMVAGKTMFLVGPHNQMYVMLAASYPTAMICASKWLDFMEPQWRAELLPQLAAKPPDFIVDSDSSFDSDALSARTGLIYSRIAAMDHIALYKFEGRSPASGDARAEPFPLSESVINIVP